VNFNIIPSGTITSVPEFLAGAVRAGIKSESELDLAILYSEAPCTFAGVFTTNRIKSGSVVLSQKRLSKKQARAIVVNSGCANACVGERSLADASEMAGLTAAKLGMLPEDVLVASTGIVGVPLPMKRVGGGIKKVKLHPDGGHEFARAIMTTDTKPKEIAIEVGAESSKFTIAGVAKGSGMIHPNMATMLCFIATDALVECGFLQAALQKAVDVSFNVISVDSDTSPNDSVLLLANGLAGNETISFGNGEIFQEALTEVCLYLARSIVRDAEGSTKFVEVIVEGARKQAEARQAARAIASSLSVKTAIHGSDPNWGRIIVALGRSGIEIAEDKIELYLDDICVLRGGNPMPFDYERARATLSDDENVVIRLCLNLGDGKATAWGCDLSEEYVTINSEYTT
jgi:glutamate N-acetyltransferase/amino-acid N-acetyltransferase